MWYDLLMEISVFKYCKLFVDYSSFRVIIKLNSLKSILFKCFEF